MTPRSHHPEQGYGPTLSVFTRHLSAFSPFFARFPPSTFAGQPVGTGSAQIRWSIAQTGGRVKRIAPFLWAMLGNDRIQGGPERFVLSGVRFHFTRQGFLALELGRGDETFARRRFTTGKARIDSSAQITRWLNIGGSIERGPSVFYDPHAPFGGTRAAYHARVGLQPNSKLNHNISYNFVSLDRPGNAGHVYDVHIVNLRNTYQFTAQFLLRAIAQFDSARRRVLGDFLASYELVPGTVVHACYGSLFQKLETEAHQATARALFFKASYLARF